ncbi:YfiR family protein [Candidatus Albibeggiatoa sp. nov. NOAA]|uniref:YfiR family protein n=1 Tax=Candidatus Albibeggiatoa sp. nov. NOAA TaxID=3162724 RepID=UPI00330223BB|nr:YfiR family protein [Thiotrichaceae bacterium]
MTVPSSYAVPPAAKEYQIKAVFLFNFVNFVSWPDSAFDNRSDPFSICVVGKDPFGIYLDFTTDGQTAKDGRGLKIKRLKDNLQDIKNCHILFISDSEQNNLNVIFEQTRDLAILTVSDIDNFVKKGGMVKFFSRNNKIRLGVNPDAIKAEGLVANANLLNLSQIIRP